MYLHGVCDIITALHVETSVCLLSLCVLVFSWLSLVSNNSFYTPWHWLSQLFAQFSWDVLTPSNLQPVNQILHISWTLDCDSSFHQFPQVFDGIKVRWISGPLQNSDSLVLEPLLYDLGSVTGSSVLLEHCWFLNRHHWRQLGIQNFNVFLCVDHFVWFHEVQRASPFARETPPNHNFLWMLHCWHSVAPVISHVHWPPNSVEMSSKLAERAFVAKHDAGPLCSCPVLVLAAEFKPFLNLCGV